jgi:hypothetical protein
LKLITLLNTFIFEKFSLFNIIKKIKLFNNILTLNFNLTYSSQNNTLFKFSKISKFNFIKQNANSLLNLKIQQLKNLNFLIVELTEKITLKTKKKNLFKTLNNFQTLKTLLINEKLNSMTENNLKTFTLSNSLIKLNFFKNQLLTTINFNFYNDLNLNYNNLVILNIKLKSLL